MNDLSRDVMNRIYTGYNTKFNAGLAEADNDYLSYCEVVSSSAPIEEYPMTSLQGGMRKFIGPRVINRLTGKKVQIVNEVYEYTFGIPATDLMFDKMSLYNARVLDMGIISGNHPSSLASAILLGNPKWADGKNFFVANRTIDDKGKITINNLVALGFSAAAYATARLQMMSFTDATGIPLKLKPDLLIVGPKHEATATTMLTADTIISEGVAISNPYKNSAMKLQVNGDFIGDYADDFRLLCTSRGVKPIIVQNVFDSGLIRKDRFDDDNMFMDDEAVYGTKKICAAGPGLPQLIVAGIPN